MSNISSNNASAYLDVDSEDLAIESLLSKYDIHINNKSYLYSLSDDYDAFIEFISQLYINEEEIPYDIKNELKNNFHFKTYLIDNIQSRLNNILDNSSTIFFKEVVTIINLLSFGKDYNLFKSYNLFNLENLSKLFRDYEDKLQNEYEKKDKKNFENSFTQYVLLIETLNKICTVNSNDVYRKRTINELIDLITETINITKFKVSIGDEKINILNNILGKLLFFYSHIPFIDIKNKDYTYLINEFYFYFQKTCDGYELSKNTNFANEQNHQKYYCIFLNSLSTLLSNLIYKLHHNYDLENTNVLENFANIFDLYKQEVTHKTIKDFKCIYEFQEDLIDNFSYIYNNNTNKNYDYTQILDVFIKNKEFNSINMQIVLCIVLYSKKIDENKLIEILEILIKKDKFENDYHEYYKLSLCDVIISKLTKLNNDIIKNSLHSKIISYIETNKIASHLMAIYSKLYLSLSAYYSYYDDEKSIETTKEYFYKYISINGKSLLENEYLELNNAVLVNLGKNYVEDIKISDLVYETTKYREIGQNIIEKYAKRFEITLKYNINQKLTNIVSEIFTKEGLDSDTLNKSIENFISNEIFHGLIFCAIEGLCEEKCRLVDLGYKKLEIPLMEGYKLRMAYSKVYEHIFLEIFEKNKSYIIQNLINIIISYLKSIPIYIDSVTTLFNTNKLKKDLKNQENEEITFIEIYFDNLKQINSKYTYDKGNKLFKQFALKINEEIPVYRLQGPTLAILSNKEEYKNLIEKIKEITLNHEDINIKPELQISVTWGDSQNILEKSEYGMSLAKNSKNGYYEFK
ncbi:diguanylate cyclase domain-containing protein [Arcobacter roscoffensis]|uniref:GGDEF domain-containing protein n=1 Tax=Arcobacter roscoffensis TaxID=2961520 RepID=A0ABY5E887_9BACT|nr:diguanylate cyclase [Arcobacter roscoffensis]UTJ07363.1 GGDEF domain-containing protein [Arcobacter roscoffensis]